MVTIQKSSLRIHIWQNHVTECTLNVRVILYDLIAQKNLDSQLPSTWGAWAPNQAWVAGEQDEGAAATKSSVIGYTPFQSAQEVS